MSPQASTTSFVHSRAFAWGVVALVTALIYVTLPYVRIPVDYLRSRGMLAYTVAAMFGVAALGLVAWVGWVMRERRIWVFGLLLVVGFGYVLLIRSMQSPEERIHFLQYGLLALLVLKALSHDIHTWHRYLLAAVITALLGWLDEGIQYVLPNRFYDWRDVAFNAVAGLPPLIIAAIISYRRVLPPQTPPPLEDRNR